MTDQNHNQTHKSFTAQIYRKKQKHQTENIIMPGTNYFYNGEGGESYDCITVQPSLSLQDLYVTN